MSVADYKFYVSWNADSDFVDVYEDITSRVQAAHWELGESSSFPDPVSAGVAQLTLNNHDGMFSSFNTSSPLYGLLTPGILVRITMVVDSNEVSMFTGILEDITPYSGETVEAGYAVLRAYGIFVMFADSEVQIPTQENKNIGTLINLVLDANAFPPDKRSIDTGQTTLSKWWKKIDEGDSSTLQRLVDAEIYGRQREGKDGKYIFEDRAHLFTSPNDVPAATFGHGYLQMWNVQQEDSRSGIYNIIKSDVRTFNKTEDIILSTKTDVVADVGGTPLIVGDTLEVIFELPPNSDYIGVVEWSTVDYEAYTDAFRTGYDITSEVSAVKTDLGAKLSVVFTNTSSVDAHLTMLRAHGVAIVEVDPTPLEAKDTVDKLKKYGRRIYPHSSEWETNQIDCQAGLDYLKGIMKDPRQRFSFDVIANVDDDHLLEVQQSDVSRRYRINDSDKTYGIGVNVDFIVDRLIHDITKENGRFFHIMRVMCTIAPTAQLAATGTAYTSKIVIPPDVGISPVPDDLVVRSMLLTDRIQFGCYAEKWNAGITTAEFRAKLYPPNSSEESVDLRTVAEGGTFVHNGTTQLIVTGIATSQLGEGIHQHFYGANIGQWFYSLRLMNAAGWSVWTDGNDTPSKVQDFVDTEADALTDTGPPSDWSLEVVAGTADGIAHGIVTRPKVNGKRLFHVIFQMRDTRGGGDWRLIDENAGANEIYYDGSAEAHTYDPATGTLIRAGGGSFGIVAGDCPMLVWDQRAGLFDRKHCRWRAELAVGVWVAGGATISGLLLGPSFTPGIDGKYTNIRCMIVKAPWTWNDADPVNVDGYGCGYGGLELWDNETVGDIDSQSFKSPPFNIPSGALLSDLQVRAFIGNTYSTDDDDGAHSENPDGSAADEGVITVKCADVVTIDASLGDIFYLTLTSDVLLANPVNLRHGSTMIVVIRQDASGGHILTLDSKFQNSILDLTSEIVVVDGTPFSKSYFGFIYDGDTNKIDVIAFVSGYGGL